MQKKYVRTALGVGAIALATLTFTAGSWSMPGFGGGHGMKGVFNSLDLDEEQRVAIESRLDAARSATEADRQRMRELRELARELHSNYDAGEAQQLADEMGEITGRLIFSKMSTRADIRSLLSAEQIEQLEARAEQRRAYRKGWRDARRGGRQLST